MTTSTEGYSVRDHIPQLGISCEWFDMMRMQDNSFTSPFMVVSTTLLAGIIVTFKYCFAPFAIFGLSARYVVLVGLVNMICKSRFIGFLCGIAQHAFCFVEDDTGGRTGFSFSTFRFIFQHCSSTVRAGCCQFQTIIANTFCVCFFPIVWKARPTNKTGYTNAARFGISARGTCSAITGCGFSKFTDLWTWLAAIWTWSKSSRVARGANAVIPSVTLANFTFVFHTANIPQLAGVSND